MKYLPEFFGKDALTKRFCTAIIDTFGSKIST